MFCLSAVAGMSGGLAAACVPLWFVSARRFY